VVFEAVDVGFDSAVADVVADGFVGEIWGVGEVFSCDGGEVEELAHEGVVGGEVFELIVVAVAGVADDAEDEDLLVGEARATFVFVYAGEDFLDHSDIFLRIMAVF
jgi:hypothetical protein